MKTISKILGLFAVLAIVSACGKSGTGTGNGSSFAFTPLTGPGIGQNITDLQTQISNISMSTGLPASCFGNCNFKTREYNINYNSGTWLGFINYNFGGSMSQVGSTITTSIVSHTTDSVTTFNGVITKSEIMNRIFRPDLDSSFYGTCGGPKSIVQAQTTNSGYGINVQFQITENCSGVTKYLFRSHYVDLSYPLIMNPVQATDYTTSNNGQSMNPSKAKVNAYN